MDRSEHADRDRSFSAASRVRRLLSLFRRQPDARSIIHAYQSILSPHDGNRISGGTPGGDLSYQGRSIGWRPDHCTMSRWRCSFWVHGCTVIQRRSAWAVRGPRECCDWRGHPWNIYTVSHTATVVTGPCSALPTVAVHTTMATMLTTVSTFPAFFVHNSSV